MNSERDGLVHPHIFRFQERVESKQMLTLRHLHKRSSRPSQLPSSAHRDIAFASCAGHLCRCKQVRFAGTAPLTGWVHRVRRRCSRGGLDELLRTGRHISHIARWLGRLGCELMESALGLAHFLCSEGGNLHNESVPRRTAGATRALV